MPMLEWPLWKVSQHLNEIYRAVIEGQEINLNLDVWTGPGDFICFNVKNDPMSNRQRAPHEMVQVWLYSDEDFLIEEYERLAVEKIGLEEELRQLNIQQDELDRHIKTAYWVAHESNNRFGKRPFYAGTFDEVWTYLYDQGKVAPKHDHDTSKLNGHETWVEISQRDYHPTFCYVTLLKATNELFTWSYIKDLVEKCRKERENDA